MDLSATAVTTKLWRNRAVLQDLHRNPPSGPASTSSFYYSSPSSSISPTPSSHFDVESCLARLRRDKANVVRASFNAAALTVVEAVKQHTNDNNDDDEDQNGLSPYNPQDLPHELTQWQQWEHLRNASFEKAQDAKKSSAARPSSLLDSKGGGVFAEAIPSAPTTGKATTAASAAVLDSRATVSRAVLCSAASLALGGLTPAFGDEKLDPLDIPQNSNRTGKNIDITTASNIDKTSSSSSVNMGAVLLQAQTMGQRAIDQGNNAARRSTQRYQFRQVMAPTEPKLTDLTEFLRKRLRKREHDNDDDNDDDDDDTFFVKTIPPARYNPNPISPTQMWNNVCWPRMQSILHKGTGHAIVCDLDWSNRHGRIASILRGLAEETDPDKQSFGPHLIITTQPDVDRFCQEFQAAETKIRFVTPPQSPPYEGNQGASLKVLSYLGSRAQRRKLRQTHFGDYHGHLHQASYHVMVTSYGDFLEDYLHFCQVPFQVVVLDEGFSWLAAAQADPNSQLGSLWSNGIFSNNDQHIGLAGSNSQIEWDFTANAPSAKKAYIGLTARHRILTTSSMVAMSSQKHKASTLSGLLTALLPHFGDVVREEWDRSRITHDQPSMDHLKKLLTRSIVVHQHDAPTTDLAQLALDSIEGRLTDMLDCQAEAPTYVADEDFVAEGKISQSRRSALAWLSPWLRYELGMAHFSTILSAMKESTTHGHVCEEIIPASSTTSSGAGGTVSGSLAYRLAVRCGRSFGSEQGLRQHMAALHAPPGTWLCRTCGIDCGTSQARTHHERTCGQPVDAANPNPQKGSAAGNKNQHGPVGVVGKKAKGSKHSPSQDKDADGSFRVPGYRGVWVNPAGKHFIKVNKKRWDKDGAVAFFETVELAAKQHDQVLQDGGLPKNAELNYKPDGTRIVYEDSTAASAAGRGLEMLGGGTSSVVPALSVINIKDLPKDVKPLLRDPRQTSRTGGNSKRHVYAYRGVCRQARKGHDRWQSQISFGGTNHYLGTFDSEWDAAAVYAWAHLILYGEEATKKAQREGEEAAAAYEREKAAIAAGEVLPPPPKQEKKKKTKRKLKDADDGDAKKRRASPDGKKGLKADGGLASILAKGVTKAPVLSFRKEFESKSDQHLFSLVKARVMAARSHGYRVVDGEAPQDVQPEFRPCVQLQESSSIFTNPGAAMLVGLNPSLFGWMVDTFVPTCDFESDQHEDKAVEALTMEYDAGGCNASFRSVMQGTICVLGCATRQTKSVCMKIGIALPLGGTVGYLDCHIGGVRNSCSDAAAVIQYAPTSTSKFQLVANNETDCVTLNGKRITASMGSFPLFNEDICTVGARVFILLLPVDSL